MYFDPVCVCVAPHQHKVAVLLHCILAGDADSSIVIISQLDTDWGGGRKTMFEVAVWVLCCRTVALLCCVLIIPDGSQGMTCLVVFTD